MQLNGMDRRWARGEVRGTDNQTGYPDRIDARRFEKPSCFLFRPVKHGVSYRGIIEQFDRTRLPCAASRALPCA